jgi:hypothetical protein
MIANDTIVDADINSAAAITLTKLGTGALPATITVASGNIVDGTISNVEISASAAIADTKLDTISTADKVSLSALNIDGGTDIGAALADADLFIVDDGGAGTNRKAAATRITDYAFGKVSGDITITSSGVAAIGSGKVTSTMILDGTILNADVNASAAIAGTKISPDFGSQTVTTTGIFSAALGAQGTPTITFTGDTNTGIYSPGADQVAISTNGTGRLFVDASGRVGIGTAPSSLLHLQVPSGSAQIQFKSGSNTDSYFGLDTAYNTGLDIASGGATTFRNFNGAIFSETLRITAAGLLGLGTSSPGALLHLSATAGNQELRLSDTTNTAMGRMYVANGTYLISETAHPLVFQTNATNRMTIDSSGNVNIDSNTLYVDATNNRVGIGTSSPGNLLHVESSFSGTLVKIKNNAGSTSADTALEIESSTTAAKTFLVKNAGTERFYVKGDGTSYFNGSVGIGITAPSELLSLNSSSSNAAVSIRTGGASFNSVVKFNADDTNYAGIGLENTALVMRCSNSSTPTERARIDSSGRLLVGTSSGSVFAYSTEPSIQVESNSYFKSSLSVFNNENTDSGSILSLGKSRGTAVGSNTVVQSGDYLGEISWVGADGSDRTSIAASINCRVDGTPGSNDMPGRLVFSTCPDGSASPTERMRITSGGDVLIAKTSSSFGTGDGTVIGPGYLAQTRTSATPFTIIRNGTDGTLVSFEAQNVEEGTISVSGTTVQLNGAHLSRWSQLINGGREDILRGTVLSNLDEMCEWGDQANEQLNRMKVSDVEGDLNVAGVFVDWDNDDETYTDDFYCAMTGDFIIRIAEGVTVQRGDLLMSAGDGTAKPQDDDIIRSKTIAKVTSTHVTCTYDDGSYCVPCVLMAC